jgi:WD40 repeat protein
VAPKSRLYSGLPLFDVLTDGVDKASWWERCSAAVNGEPERIPELAGSLADGQETARVLQDGIPWPDESRGQREGPALSAAHGLLELVQAVQDPAVAKERFRSSMSRWTRLLVLAPRQLATFARPMGASPGLDPLMRALDELAEDPAAGYVQLVLMALTKTLRRPGPQVSIPVVFGDGNGSHAKLTLSRQPGGPAGLYRDPRLMTFLVSDEEFAAALGQAWTTSPLRLRSQCVVWDITDDGRPCKEIAGGSLGAAFGVGLQELDRLMGGRARLRLRRLDPRCAITGGLDSNGRLLPVGGYVPKLHAAERQKWSLLAPKDDPESTRHKEIRVKVRHAADLRSAVRRCRIIRARRGVLAGATAIVVALAAIATILVVREIHTQASTVQTLAASSADIPQEIVQDLQQYEKSDTPQTASAVDAAAAQPLVASIQTPAAVNTLAYSPGGGYLISGDVDGDVFVDYPATGKSTAYGARAIVGPVNTIAFSPNGTTLAGGDDNLVFLASLTKGTLTTVNPAAIGATGSPGSVIFSPDGKTLTVGTVTGYVFMQDLGTSATSALITGGSVSSLAYSPDGKTLAIGNSDGKVSLHHFHHFIVGENSTFDYGGQITSVAYSPGGTILASGDSDGNVYLQFASGASTILVTGGSVSSVAFSPHGHILAIGDSDGDVFLYDPVTGAETSLGVGSPVGALAFSPDGKNLATGDASQINVWAMSGIAATLALGGDATSIAFSADSKVLAAGYANGTVILDNLTTGGTRTVHDSSHIYSVALSPNGKWLAIGDTYGLVLDNLVTGSRRFFDNTNVTEPTDPTPDSSVAFSPDSDLLAVAGSGGYVVLNVATGQPTSDGSDVSGNMTSVSFSPHGTALAAGTDEGVFLLNPRTGLQQPTLASGNANIMPDYNDAAGSSSVSSVAYSPSGTVLAIGDAAGHVILYRAAGGTPIATYADGAAVSSVAYSPDGEWLASGTADGEVILRNLRTGSQITEDEGADVTSVVFSPDGQWLASTVSGGGDQNQQVNLYGSALWTRTSSTATLKKQLCDEVGNLNLTSTQWAANFPGQPYQQTCPTPAPPEPAKQPPPPPPNPFPLTDPDYHSVSSLAFSQGKTTIIAEGDTEGVVYMFSWNGSSATQESVDASDADGQPVTSAAFTAYQNVFGFGDSDGHAYLGAGTLPIPGSQGTTAPPVMAVAFTPDGKTFATADGTGHIYLWNTRTGQLTATLNDPASRGIKSVAFSPDGGTLAAAGNNGRTDLWSGRTWRLTATVTDPGSRGTNSVAFSPDGGTLATADGNGHTYLWNTGTWRLTATLTDLGAPPVNAVAFSPDGKILVTADASGHAYLWSTATYKHAATLTDPGSDGDNAIAFSPNGKVLGVVDANGKAYLWTLTSRTH